MLGQSFPEGKILFVTDEDKVLCNQQDSMPDSDHEEADTRLCLHIQDALSKGMKNIVVNTVDTDVFIILLGIFHRLQSSYSFTDIIFHKPDPKNKIRVSLKDLSERLGQATCQALPFLHAFTGSDTTSAFKNIGKKKGYGILQSYEDALETFSAMFMNPFQHLNMEMNEFKIMQRFVILMYSKSSEFTKVNTARQGMFFQTVDTVPPTENALFQHCLRAIYQTGVWSRCLETYQNSPAPNNFGWKRSNNTDVPWEPVWITNGEASKECREFVKCQCKAAGGCVRCKCTNANMVCTMLCTCTCTNRFSYDD